MRKHFGIGFYIRVPSVGEKKKKHQSLGAFSVFLRKFRTLIRVLQVVPQRNHEGLNI